MGEGWNLTKFPSRISRHAQTKRERGYDVCMYIAKCINIWPKCAAICHVAISRGWFHNVPPTP